MCFYKHPPDLRLAVLLNPAENARRQLLEAAHWNRAAERLKQGVHDALKDVELDLVGHLILSLLWVVLVGLHYVLIVPIKRIKKKFFFTNIKEYKISQIINLSHSSDILDQSEPSKHL